MRTELLHQPEIEGRQPNVVALGFVALNDSIDDEFFRMIGQEFGAESPVVDPFEAEFDRMMSAEFGDTASELASHTDDAAPEGFGETGPLTEEQIDAMVADFAHQLGTDQPDNNGEMHLTDDDRDFLETNGIAARAMTYEELEQVHSNEARVRAFMQAEQQKDQQARRWREIIDGEEEEDNEPTPQPAPLKPPAKQHTETKRK